MNINGTMMQYFHWDVPKGMLWNQLRDEAEKLAELGITAVWIPPAYKGSAGENDVGYGPYDLYDLGEFDQKGGVPTRYGHKDELLAAIQALHNKGIQVYADMVLDHKMGADATEEVLAIEYNPENRNEQEGETMEIEAWTHFFFPGRNKKYSDFEWHWYHFKGTDWDAIRDEEGIYKFFGKEWSKHVDKENGNFDYLMGADLDLNNQEVKEELHQWGVWFLRTTDVDGLRLDAVKHMNFLFFQDWLTALRSEVKEELFTVGEYWSGDLNALKAYMETTGGSLSLFDVPLHFHFSDASDSDGNYDMRNIFNGTLVQDNPDKAVTFVDNHDTQPSQSLRSWVEGWFKPHAYALILLRSTGYPCLYYGDFYGIAYENVPPMEEWLTKLLLARKERAYGEQHDYIDHPHIIGWTREGDDDHPDSGLAVVLTNKDGGEKRMFMGKKFAGRSFYDCLGNRGEKVVIEEDGNGVFPVNGGSVSVWLPGEK